MKKEEKWKLGLEAYYFSKQPLTDGKTGGAYWTFGFMGEKLWKQFSLFINFENSTDTRQTRFDTIYTASVSHPDLICFSQLAIAVAESGRQVRCGIGCQMF